ncbi:MAG: hypothetical protein E7D52_05475 [Peptoniphilus harei]|nr:hypothetical protein [Peptoniphilus harei]MDU1177701.1 hypothetical protein [Peptoniphilus harei]MDU2373984.1 hypothetical protein [Peptoniphilus harei]
MLEAKAYFPTTSIAGGLFMLKRTKKARPNKGRATVIPPFYFH